MVNLLGKKTHACRAKGIVLAGSGAGRRRLALGSAVQVDCAFFAEVPAHHSAAGVCRSRDSLPRRLAQAPLKRHGRAIQMCCFVNVS